MDVQISAHEDVSASALANTSTPHLHLSRPLEPLAHAEEYSSTPAAAKE